MAGKAKRVLVTGGAGFIPSNLIRHLLKQVPYERLKDAAIQLPPLEDKVRKERFVGAVKPIEGWY